MRGRKSDFTGKKFYFLTVVKAVGSTADKHIKWLCLCKCGNTTEVASNALVKGTTKSCGCYYSSLKNGHVHKTRRYEDTRNDVLLRYQHVARKAGREFSIPDDVFFKMVQQPCHYCGTAPKSVMSTPSSKKTGRKEFVYNGVDRVNSSKGYVKGNCVPCCIVCNRIKNNHSVKFLRQHLTKMLSNMKGD